LTRKEVDELYCHSAGFSHSLRQKTEEAKNLAIESTKKNKISKMIEKNFGIKIENPEHINTSGDKIVHVHVHTDNEMNFVQSSVTPGDESGRFFRFDDDLNVTEIFPKVRVVTKTEVSWSDEDPRATTSHTTAQPPSQLSR